MLKRLSLLLPLCLLVVLLLPGRARASIFDLYGMGARGLGMGGAMAPLAADYSGAFYNPGAITQRKQVTFGAAFMLTLPVLDVRRGVPVCLNGPAVCGGRHGGLYSDRETVVPDTFSGFTVGWVFPYGGVFENRLATAIALYVPTINLVRAEALDPQTPQFYMYQNLPDQLVLMGSIAYRPLDWFSFGVGFQILANVFGEASFGLDIANKLVRSSDITVELAPTAAAIAGLHFQPTPGLKIGVSYRQAIGLEFALPAFIDAEGLANLELQVEGSVLYQPHQFGLGVSYTWEAIGLTVSAQVDYAMWSLAPDPSPKVAVDFSGGLLEAFGLEDTIDVSSGSEPIELQFHDTVTPRIGVEWGPLTWLQLRAGYHYRPSPAPRSTGSSNYLDNDVHAFGFGAAFVIGDPLSDTGKPVSIEIGNQLGWLPRRTVVKDNPVDPVGNLEHGGFTYGLSITINHQY